MPATYSRRHLFKGAVFFSLVLFKNLLCFSYFLITFNKLF